MIILIVRKRKKSKKKGCENKICKHYNNNYQKENDNHNKRNNKKTDKQNVDKDDYDDGDDAGGWCGGIMKQIMTLTEQNVMKGCEQWKGTKTEPKTRRKCTNFKTIQN